MGDPWLAAHGLVAQQKPEGTANNPEGTANTNATRQQWLKEALGGLDNLQPALRALAERRARFKCEPAPAVDVIGLFLLLPAPLL